MGKTDYNKLYWIANKERLAEANRKYRRENKSSISLNKKRVL